MAKKDVELRFSLVDGVSQGLASIRKSVGDITTTVAGIGAAAAAATAALATVAGVKLFNDGIQSAAAFEQSLAKIGAKANISGDELDALGNQIRQIGLGATKTADESAAAFDKLVSEGLSATDALAQLPAILDFATASSQNAAEAVGSLTDNLDAFGLSANSVSEGADIISAAALRGGTGVSDLQKALQTVGPTARDMGLSLSEASAAIATLSANGIEGGKAGKALASVLDEIRNPASLFRKELADIGITSGDFKTILTQLSTTGADTSRALAALGINGTAALKILAKDGGAQLRGITDGLRNAGGASKTLADQINDTLSGALTRLGAAFANARDSLVAPLLEPLANEVDELAAKITAFAATPEFAGLRDAFKRTFLDAVDWVKQFAGSFDLTSATASVTQFVKDAGAQIESLAGSAETAAKAIGVLANVGKAGGNILQSAFDGIVLAGTKIDLAFRKVEAAQGIIRGGTADLERLSEAAGENLRSNLNELRDALGLATVDLANAGAAADSAAGSVAGSGDAAAGAVPEIQALADAQGEAAAAAKTLGDAQGEIVGSIDGAAGALANFGNAAKLAAENAAIQAKITEDSKGVFDQQKTSVESSARASRDHADASNELGESAKNSAADVSLVGDAALVTASNLSESILKMVNSQNELGELIAGLQGAGDSVEAVARATFRVAEANSRAINGSLDGLEEIRRQTARNLEAFDKLGGSKALEKVRADAKAAADAIANLSDTINQARADLDQLNADLQDQLDQAAGNQEAIEKRRFDAQKNRIDELEKAAADAAELARQQGDAESIARARAAAEAAARARALADELHRQNLQDIEDEKTARIDADRESKSSEPREPRRTRQSGGGGFGTDAVGPVGSVSITINVQALTGQAGIEAAARELIPVIQKLNRRTL